ncbi:hypothetical protein EO92_05635 [Methanosarcina sp. 2.H.A.1B.4]|nr:hypothetical protein EO92_05635 [Methanosarcina sp. 2.H.A.1B.4]
MEYITIRFRYIGNSFCFTSFSFNLEWCFYRLDSFEVVKLEIYIENNIQCIESFRNKSFRNRDIFSLSDSDQDKIEDLFWSSFHFFERPLSCVERDKNDVRQRVEL